MRVHFNAPVERSNGSGWIGVTRWLAAILVRGSRSRSQRLARTIALATGIGLTGISYATVEQLPDGGVEALIDRMAGTEFVDGASLKALSVSPAGTANASAAAGAQELGLLAAAQAVNSAGRTAGQFSVNSTGAASYNIPLWTPPGAREIEPHLALHYSSGGPDGLLGPGWTLSGVSAIARCGKTWVSSSGAPTGVSLATSDDLCLDGARLRLTGGSQGLAGSTYQTDIANFSLVTAFGTAGNGPSYFIVQGKDGRTYEYGNTADSQIFGSSATTPYAWALNKVRDRQGNNMTYAYAAGSSMALSRIQYTATPGTGNAAPYQVDFAYVARSGGTSLTKYVAGKVTSQSNQLDSVTMSASGVAVRKYLLTYSPSPTTNRPLLQSVQECGGSASTDCLRPTAITYQSGGSGWSSTATSSGLTGQYGFLPVDFTGDGIADVIYGKLAGTTIQWFARVGSTTGYGAELSTGASTGAGQTIIPGAFDGTSAARFLSPVGTTWYVYKWNGSAFSSASTAIAVNGEAGGVDYDGDGLPDLMAKQGSNIVVRRNTSSGGTVSFAATSQTVATIGGTYNGTISSTYTSFVDFNGDGKGDLLYRWGTAFMGVSFQYTTVLLSNGFGSSPTSLLLANQFVVGTPGDWNADGCTDLIGWGTVYVSNCAGAFSTVSVAALLNGPNGVATAAVDWDSDGQTDYLYANPTTNTWYVQRSTGAGAATGVSTGIPAPTTSSFFVADKNSDGLPELFQIDSASAYSVKFYPHNAATTPPDLATSFTDGFGIAFNPTYKPISQSNYSKGSGATFPELDFQGPMYVVDQFSASDGVGGAYTNQFYYWTARLHLQGRGFEGFGAVRRWDSRNGVYTLNYYRTDFPYIGAVSETHVFQPNNTTLVSKTVNSYTYTTLQGTACNVRCFPYASNTTVYHYEVGGPKDGQLISTDATTYTYDIYGSLTNTALVQTDNDAYVGQQWTTTVANTITNDVANWCLGRPARTTTTRTAPGQVTQTRTVDHTMDYVQCRASAEIVEPASTTLKVTSNFTFDACGNTSVVSVVGLDRFGAAMPARAVTTSYGTRCQLPELVTNALNQQTIVTNRYDLGVKGSITDANNVVIGWQYDAFGRRTRETHADGTFTTWAYSDCVATTCWGVADLRFLTTEIQYDANSVALRTRQQFFDGLDRLRYDEWNRALGTWTVAVTGYDTLGRTSYQYLPFSSAGNGYHGYAYDLANRPTVDTLYTSAGAAYRTVSIAYKGDTTVVTDPRGNAVTKVSDPTGKIRQLIDPAPGGTTRYTYDSFGNLVNIVDATNASSLYGYNIRGFKTSASDADSGSWVFVPNSLNELVSQTDAKSQTTTYAYDLLGRKIQQTEPEYPATPTQWVYGTSSAAHNIGRLQSVSKPDGYGESYTYDAVARASTATYTVDGVNYQFDYSYNVLGSLDTVTYPTSTSGVRWVLKHVYDAYGYLNKTQDNATGANFWVLNSTNDSGLPTNELLGNAVQVVSGYTPHTNELATRTEGPGGNLSGLQNLSYTWDVAGNLQQRQDLRQGLTEAFVNDPLNRLTSATLNAVSTLSVQYDAAGNIVNKSDVGIANYVYGDPAHKHAVTQAGGSTMTYDANGNMTARNGGTITWTSYNLPASISQGTSSTQFFYGADHQRWKQVANYAGTVETTRYVGGRLEVMTRGGVTEYRHQIPAGSATAIYTRRTNSTNSTYYATSDHLGSADLVLDSSGGVLTRASFTPFGARRGSNWQGAPTTGDYSIFAQTTRQGFTGHEMLDSVSLIHMNGRVYDPYLGRFISADNVVQSLGSSQSVNPYAYAWNAPLRYVDPSGHSLLGAIVGIIAAVIVALLLPEVLFIQIGSCSAIAISSSVIAGFVGGFVGALVSTGSLSAALTAGLLSGLAVGLGGFISQRFPGSEWLPTAERTVARAAVGCASTAVSGGNCGRGAISAGITEAASSTVLKSATVGQWGPAGQAAVAGLIGGASARVAGGHFVDGFGASAVQYLVGHVQSELGAKASPGGAAESVGDAEMAQVTITAMRDGGTNYAWTYANGFLGFDFVNNGETLYDEGALFAQKLQQAWNSGAAMFGTGAVVGGTMMMGGGTVLNGGRILVNGWRTAVQTAGNSGRVFAAGMELVGAGQELTGASAAGAAFSRVPASSYTLAMEWETAASQINSAVTWALETSTGRALQVAISGGSASVAGR